MATLTVDELVAECRKRTPKALALFYNWAFSAIGFTLPAHMYPVAQGLCDTRIPKLQMQCGPGSTKSQLLSIAYPAFTLGHEPFRTILGISGAEDLSQGFMAAVMDIIKTNPAFLETFPDVKPDKDKGWSPASGAFVVGHPSGVPDASFWACGISSVALTGKHGNIIILDDLHDDKNSATAEQCAGVVRKYSSQIVGRAAPNVKGESARFILAGRRWNVDDLYGALEYNGDWVTMRLPAERPGSTDLYYDVYVPEGIECVFTDGMCLCADGEYTIEREEPPPFEYLERKNPKADDVPIRHYKWAYGKDPSGEGFFWPQSSKRGEYFSNKRLSPSITEAVYQCNPGARQGSVFVDEDFSRRFEAPDDLDAGAQGAWLQEAVAAGGVVVQAWDTAFSANATSDYTVGVTALLVACDHYHNDEDPEVLGPCEAHNDVYLLDIFRERVNFAGTATAIRSAYFKWQPQVVVVEKKAYGVTAVENLEAAGLPIEAVTPGALESKRARAVEGVAGGSAQGWFRSHRVLLPSEAAWDIAAFVREMKDFTGEKGGRDDQVDAVVHLIRWAITNGRGAASVSGWSTPEEVDANMRRQGMVSGPGDVNAYTIGPGAINEMVAGLLGDVLDPFDGFCGRCRHFVQNIRERKLKTNVDTSAMPSQFCAVHRRPTPAMASCDDFEHPDQVAIRPSRF